MPAWQQVADDVESALTEHFGSAPARASVSFLGVEPIEILRFRRPDRWAYCSLGMARRPMTAANSAVLEIAGPRAELVVEVDGGERVGRGDAPAEIWKTLAIFAAAPTVESVVYSPGMTVDSGRPVVPGSRCTGALVVESDLPDVSTAAGLVSLLRLVPATAQELAWARVHGVRALQQRFGEHGVDLLNLWRPGVPLADPPARS